MKLFGRTGGYWLFWTGFIYFILGIVDVFLLKEHDYSVHLQILWILVMTAPLVIKPLARWLNMKTFWEI